MKNSSRTHKVRPVFVGGTGRSGTTVMGDLLGSHEDIRTSESLHLTSLARFVSAGVRSKHLSKLKKSLLIESGMTGGT